MANKKELMPVNLTKLILTVSIIVSLGALFGAVGYLLSHPRQTIAPVVNPLVAVNPNEKEMNIITDKTKYEQEEQVGFSLENNSQKEYKISPEFHIELKKESSWQLARIYNAACNAVVPVELDLLAGKTMVAQWNPKDINACDTEIARKKTAGGVYRIKATALIFTNNKSENVNFYSNEFTIKEKKSEDVSITTDKTIYDKGEIIKIVVNNGLDKPILYSSWGDRFWGIEYFEDDKWINPTYKEGGFQLTEENIGNTCNIVLYERSVPEELTSQSNLTSQWNQKICLFGTEEPDKSNIVRYMESGKYRLVFFYGFEISSNDPFIILESKAVYSDEFIIK